MEVTSSYYYFTDYIWEWKSYHSAKSRGITIFPVINFSWYKARY